MSSQKFHGTKENCFNFSSNFYIKLFPKYFYKDEFDDVSENQKSVNQDYFLGLPQSVKPELPKEKENSVFGIFKRNKLNFYVKKKCSFPMYFYKCLIFQVIFFSHRILNFTFANLFNIHSSLS